ncbi:hypothetical protein LY90DRAFT_666788 [Neocallimastix californiae]|uniref:N-acetyltransferase domain-containing protein n=1 Tax=Neocallimastix californiae TaxID=1754190 RepID=A0A1Y2ENP1_9FUNG|nr:hypothetical protein LY90DRAFT_666788 [Neocallimastix californiae]|eukprot:ORY73191.1 hypothetical protein LY90DRAFT_666788 [Neocallimastix californiae]
MANDDINIIPYEGLKELNNAQKESIIQSIQKLEKKIFPKNEQMEILNEIKKRTNTLILALSKNSAPQKKKNKLKNKKKSKTNLKNSKMNELITEKSSHSENYIVNGYLIYSKKDSIIKFAVDPSKRNSGIGWKLLSYSMQRMTNQTPKDHKINLAVDVNRLPAQHLYTKSGFKIKEQINDYYEPGRHAYIMEYVVS